MKALARFNRRHVVDPCGCWLWLGALTRDGYGVMHFNGRSTKAHRWSYETFVGPIPAGLELDHLCRNRACVNPTHLEPVTHHENVLRGDVGKFWAAKTHCPAGHEYSDSNTYIGGNGKRQCRTCRADRDRDRAAKREKREGFEPQFIAPST